MSTEPLTVLVLARVDDRYLEMIRAVDPRVRVIAAADLDRAAAAAPQADAIVAWQIPSEVLARASRLRWIHTTAAGADGLIVPAVREGRVVLTSSVGIHTVGLPEHVMALVLAFARRLHVAVRQQAARRWDRAAVVGEEIQGKTLGILGLGAIGRAVAERAAAFGMRVIGTRRTPTAVPHVERVLGPEGTDEVLRAADYLVIVVPLTPQTEGLIDARALGLMKRSAILINVGRGKVVREADLIAALREGVIAGAGLDVFEREPLPADSPLYAMENVIITPHVSGASRTYYDRAIPLFCDNLRRFLDGRPMVNVVDPGRGY
ncbi:MAG: D-2-hydroxyacid dehydrogenase [Armatimonadota bacterium]|nr:D-2-hydroxyacid dehydrogenase [Armatimonadota bacterium]MDR7421165.1 D-2-hydroxyacid dehydrogenase [Armatimonadota bacterium]MDR7453482.1 D-2-hydroxyacid dehydrogenase [Armatimonadota bacterium]MDR7457262.1 D-2-hydroxyacid dehydrogenase [Armatimonadota bacterium]MDR7496089.1 D-2-hydroxyacid dehydrogenase [Armatimonadota bacterium]